MVNAFLTFFVAMVKRELFVYKEITKFIVVLFREVLLEEPYYVSGICPKKERQFCNTKPELCLKLFRINGIKKNVNPSLLRMLVRMLSSLYCDFINRKKFFFVNLLISISRIDFLLDMARLLIQTLELGSMNLFTLPKVTISSARLRDTSTISSRVVKTSTRTRSRSRI